jgi:PPM family protein phosphatase
VKTLVDLANLRGGPDNITVLIARIAKPEAATATSQAPPLTLGGKKDLTPVNPAIWISAGVFALAAVVLLLIKPILAIVAAVAAVIAVIVGLVKLYSGFSSGTKLGGGRLLGKGPYTSTACGPTPAFFTKLQQTASELRQVALDGNYQIDWAEYDELQRKCAAAQQSNPVDAVRQLCKAISFLMSELRTQHERKGSDSTIKY